jgi:type I restriction-modification system DNA methylase subunit
MPLSWNEIKDRALKFSKDWQHTSNEEADAKPFLDAFFEVFGIPRRKIGTFEHRVKKLNEADGYIDLLWKGTILVEMKSRGKNLDKAFTQAKEYAQGLPAHELPKYILVCDFDIFRLYDTEENTTHEFTLTQFVKHVHLFGFISGYQKKVYKEQDPANVKAAELMGKLHDSLEAIGYTGHALEVYLVRLLFCLFAEDTTIFEKQQLQDYIEQRTNADGSDLAAKLQELFQVLNTASEKRFTNLDEQLAAFPYVNGRLFEEPLPTASFDSKMRQALLNCCYIDWSQISPAIFGSMFQSVMNPKERRNLGAHYTSEKNILKLIKPLFLDELWAEFNKIKTDKPKLKKLQTKISKLRFLDPACGCGNFLIIAYRELRLLELEIVKAILGNQQITSINDYFLVEVDKFYGIEYEEFPAQIAQVAMWLIDHQMNMKASKAFGEYYVRLPLRKSATIKHGNALRIDWQSLLEPQLTDLWNKEDVENLRYDYIMGNPPFIGERQQSEENRKDLEIIFGEKIKLDYVAAWYFLAKNFIVRYDTKVAFVSTNSISQGEQVALLWSKILDETVEIFFAHRTFKWNNEAKGNAAVFCVIVGMAKKSNAEKFLFEYEDIKGEAHIVMAKNINPYLIDSNTVFIDKKSSPINVVPKMQRGSDANDKGFLLFTEQEMNDFLVLEPLTSKYFKKAFGAYEFINNVNRYALWLEDVNPSELRLMKYVLERINKIKQFRATSPHLFGSIRKPKSKFLFVPQMSSQNREYIPIGFLNVDNIPLGPHFFIDDASIFHFGILTSKMHNIWIRNVCGRLKSDLRYSNSIVYNNFPWPESPTEKQKQAVEKAAQEVLDARAVYLTPNPSPKGEGSKVGASLADLYDPLTMPPTLVKAHNALDKAVDLCYRPQPFINETKRIEFLFELYDKYTAGLFTKVKEKKAKIKK